MLIIPPIFPFASRPRKQTAPAPIAPLTLVSAAFAAHPVTRLTITFNRDIDVSAIDLTAFTVIDAAAHKHYRGSSIFGAEGNAITMNLTFYASIFAPATTLTATSANGIVGVEGGEWEGVSGLELPYP